MAVYLMGIIEEIHDQATFQRYVEQVAPVVAALEFADDAARRAFWDSPEYTAVKGLRQRSTRSNVLFADTL